MNVLFKKKLCNKIKQFFYSKLHAYVPVKTCFVYSKVHFL